MLIAEGNRISRTDKICNNCHKNTNKKVDGCFSCSNVYPSKLRRKIISGQIKSMAIKYREVFQGPEFGRDFVESDYLCAKCDSVTKCHIHSS